MDMVKMGSFLAELRKEQKLTQSELGEKLGVTNKTVSRWETGTYMPPVEILEELSRLYSFIKVRQVRNVCLKKIHIM